MASGLLFYSDVVPLNREGHRDHRIATGAQRFGFASGSNLVPAVIDEFAAAAPHLPIVFLPGPGAPAACFLTGVRSGRNALVGADGGWRGDYVPAYLRRYPFVLGEVEGADPLVCIDAGQASLEAPAGEALFKEDGAESDVLLDHIRLTNEFFVAAKRTEAFVKALAEMGLFRSVNIDAKFETGETVALHGFLTVDEEKLGALPDESFLRLRKLGLLAPIYAHLASLACVERVRKLS